MTDLTTQDDPRDDMADSLRSIKESIEMIQKDLLAVAECQSSVAALVGKIVAQMTETRRRCLR